MFRNSLVVQLVVLMVLPLPGDAQISPTVQEQIVQIAKGSTIEVKTKLTEMKKVTGRLGEVTAEGFEVQVARGQTVDNVKLRFADVKSVKEKRGMSVLSKGVLIALVVVGVLAVLGAIIAATGVNN